MNSFQPLTSAGLGGLSGTEAMVVLAVAFALFGGRNVAKVGKAAVAGMKSFLFAMSEGIKGFARAMKEDDTRR